MTTKKKKGIIIMIAAVIVVVAAVFVACDKQSVNVTEEQAAKIAFANLGVSERVAEDVVITPTVKAGQNCYRVEFSIGNVKYSYRINPDDGSILGLSVNDQAVDSENKPFAPENPQANYIGADRAKEIVFNEVGCSENEATALEVEFDFDDGKYLYEIQFVYNGKEYEYELVAETGEIYKVEIDDVTVVVPSEESGSYFTAGQAKEIAFADSGINEADAVLKKVKFERDHGTCVYEVEFVVNRTEYEYEINAISGAIIKKEIEGEKETDIPTGDGYVGAETAMNTAIAHSGADATAVTEKNVKLKIENGVYVYEVEFKQGGFEYEYLIDAKSGNVVSVEKELDD